VSEHTTTQCVLFPGIFKRPVIAKFDQSQGSSDGGAVLLKAADQELGLIAALADCLQDDRQAGKVRHELDALLTQRIMAIACGYEDANDAARRARRGHFQIDSSVFRIERAQYRCASRRRFRRLDCVRIRISRRPN